jgi:predicted metal-dependent phosphoesterase TrpH
LILNENDRWADLHIHTRKSDGTYTVREVFEKAKFAGLEAIAITDHDTVAAAEEGFALEKETGVKFVPGIELSAIHGTKEVHIVALFIDWKDQEFVKKLTYFQKKRTERAKKIISKLKEHNMDVSFEDLYEFTENINNAGRLHIAKMLVARNYAKNIKDAFGRFLAEDRPAYVAKAKLTVEEAVQLVRGVNGVSILAHPGLLGADEMIPAWAKLGLNGVEVFHPDHTYEDMNRYMDIANLNGLLVSGGSDCHGASKDYTRIGKIRLPYQFYEAIYKFKNNLVTE